MTEILGSIVEKGRGNSKSKQRVGKTTKIYAATRFRWKREEHCLKRTTPPPNDSPYYHVLTSFNRSNIVYVSVACRCCSVCDVVRAPITCKSSCSLARLSLFIYLALTMLLPPEHSRRRNQSAGENEDKAHHQEVCVCVCVCACVRRCDYKE